MRLKKPKLYNLHKLTEDELYKYYTCIILNKKLKDEMLDDDVGSLIDCYNLPCSECVYRNTYPNSTQHSPQCKYQAAAWRVWEEFSL